MNRAMIAIGAATSMAVAGSAGADLVITGVIDGPLSGGVPKAIELYATADIADLSVYGIESANNGDPASAAEFALAGSATAGQYLYVASESTGFNSFFGFVPTFTSLAASINGDDAIVLYKDGAIFDVFGAVGTDGSGEPWDYLDGWAYRVDGTGPSTTFDLSDWTFSGIDALDGATSNSTASSPLPIGTYIPEPASLALLGLGGLTVLSRRRSA